MTFIEVRSYMKYEVLFFPVELELNEEYFKEKTASPEVVFSEPTTKAESIAYRKLMGVQSHGRVRGLGCRAYARESDRCSDF